MLARTALGVTLLLAMLALGAGVVRWRRSDQPVVRRLAGRVHWGVGVIAVAFLVLLAVTAVQQLVL